jgi:predicted 3-demethylubiquinone-9 3-methyltransferase (glyoxalase superfamily)
MTSPTQRIVPHLWFDDQAEEAAAFYTGLFGEARTLRLARYGSEGVEIHRRPPGSVMTVEFELLGHRFVALNGGPHFRFTPAISFFVTRESEAEVDHLWEGLRDGGIVMMELDRYPWSEKYGWIQDRYGVTWQISLGRIAEVGRPIAPSFLFVGDQYGRAEEAMDLYTSIFPDSAVHGILRWEAGEGEREGTVKHAQFTLCGQTFMVMDSGYDHGFTFNEAISLLVRCQNQEEIDRYWDRLTEGGDPAAQQCGWLKDRFGVSWQVAPEGMVEMLRDADSPEARRAFRAMLGMKRIDLAALERAYAGEVSEARAAGVPAADG